MELPEFFKTTAERLAAGEKLSSLKKIYEERSRIYRAESGTAIGTDREQALVYSITRMPATFCAVSAALKEMQKRSSFPVRSVLDAGAGTGAATFSALSLFPQIQRAVLWEREKGMIETAKEFFRDSFARDLTVQYDLGDFLRLETEEKFDLVVAAYALNELSEGERERALYKLWERTLGALVLVEPGTPKAFQRRLKMKEYMCSLGAFAAAPCPHGGPCPLPQDDWCHFVCRVPRSRLHRLVKGGTSPYEDEKFTYDVFFRDGCFSKCSDRVIRRPQIRPNAVSVKFCTPSGIREETFTKGTKDYKRARKLSVGDCFETENPRA